MSALKGTKGLREAEAFIDAFPLAMDPNKETLFSVTEFDKWASDQNFYHQNCEQATLLDWRNKLKKKINLTASSPAWLAQQGRTPFFIAVHNHGKTYKVQRVEDAFSLKAVKLPQQVKSYATTKRSAIQALLGSIKLSLLPPTWQVRISAFDREIDRYLRGIDYQTMELDREYNAISIQLKNMVQSKLISPEEIALIEAMFGVDGDENDDDED